MALFDQILGMFGIAGSSSNAAPTAHDGDWAPPAWREGSYTAAQADELSYEDFEEGDPVPPRWLGKRRNPTAGFQTLHVADLSQVKNGEARRFFAVYGVPVGWGSQDQSMTEYRERIETIEAARDGDDDFDDVLSEWGFLDEEHYEWIRERLFPGWEERGALQDQLDAQTGRLEDELQERIGGELRSELEPIEGVSMEAWAQASARIAQGGTVASALATFRLERPQWDRVSAEWNARMSRDTTATIATVYGRFFTGAAASSAATEAEPIPFERWIEVTEHQNAASARGEDAASVLALYGLTPADWGTVSGWWTERFTSIAMTRIEEYNQLSAMYRHRHATPSADDDLAL